MGSYRVVTGQNIYDVALHLYGSVEGIVDLLVNNAGLASGFEHLDEGDPHDWERMIDTNVKGLLYVTRVVSGWMIRAAREGIS